MTVNQLGPLTALNVKTLKALNRLGSATRTRIANEMGVSRNGAWRQLDKLQKLKLVRVLTTDGNENRKGRPEFEFQMTEAGAGALMNEINKTDFDD